MIPVTSPRHRAASSPRRTLIAVATVALSVAVPLRALSAQTGVPRTNTPSPNAEIFLVPLRAGTSGLPAAGDAKNVTARDGYDNQPSFSADSRGLYFTSNHGDGHTDIYRYELAGGTTRVVLATKPESEYSAMATADGRALTVIRVEADSTQRLWRLPLDGSPGAPVFTDIKPVGYFAQADDSTWAMFVLGSPATLQLARTRRAAAPTGGATSDGATSDGVTGETLARDIGRSLHRIPGTNAVSYVQKGAAGWHLMQLDPATRKTDTLVRTLERSEDVAWVDGNTVLAGQGSKLYAWRRGTPAWQEIADFTSAGMRGITRLAVSPDRRWVAIVADVRSP